MVKSGLGMIFIATALNILALAVKSFAEMEWGDMAKGLTGVGVGLGLLAGGMQLMPKDLFVRGIGLILLATALNILALAVKSFAEMEWGDMLKGFVAETTCGFGIQILTLLVEFN
jgi:hypothetical protein